MNIELIIEHLQETGKVIVQDSLSYGIQNILIERGYKTHFESTDREYIVWDDYKPSWGGKRSGAGRPSTGRSKRIIYVTDEEYTEIKKLIDKLRE